MVVRMDFDAWAALAACAGEAALLVLLLTRGARSPLAPSLAALAAVLFTWNLANLAYVATGDIVWSNVDRFASPLTTPIALHMVLRFVGQARRFRWVTIAVAIPFAALSSSALAAFVSSSADAFIRSEAWATLHFAFVVPVIVFGLTVIVVHLRRAIDPLERLRTMLLLSAAGLFAVTGSTEMLALMGLPVPLLGAVGTFGFTALLAAMALGLRVFGSNFSLFGALYLAAITASALTAYVVTFSLLSADSAAVLVSSALITVVAALGARQVWVAAARRRRQREGTLLLGQVAAQLGHDLKNPLSALKGACQFLRQERQAGRSLDAQASFLELIEAQVDRLAQVIDRYRQAGSLEVIPQRVDLNELVRSVVGLQRQTSTVIGVEQRLDPSLPMCEADPDLLSAALDNLLDNARQALPHGGVITVSTGTGDSGVWMSVSDTGEGMDPRTRERAFDDFFTTRPGGSGLGLPFVRRVVEAHGGRVALKTELSRGTEVRMVLPLRGEENRR
jgi:signal transduction histidine kinase